MNQVKAPSVFTPGSPVNYLVGADLSKWTPPGEAADRKYHIVTAELEMVVDYSQSSLLVTSSSVLSPSVVVILIDPGGWEGGSQSSIPSSAPTHEIFKMSPAARGGGGGGGGCGGCGGGGGGEGEGGGEGGGGGGGVTDWIISTPHRSV